MGNPGSKQEHGSTSHIAGGPSPSGHLTIPPNASGGDLARSASMPSLAMPIAASSAHGRGSRAGPYGRPRYLNSRSMVYSSDVLQPADDGISGTDLFDLGTPMTPLSTSTRRNFSSPNKVQQLIAPPIYNANTQAADDITCSSPVLMSYRSFRWKDQSPAGAVGDPLGASGILPPLERSICISGTFSADNFPVSSSAPVGGETPQLHTRFMAITGNPVGLENYGNTCYCNSVMQLLYYCTPIRLRLLELHDIYNSKRGGQGFGDDTILYHLCQLIATMHESNNKRQKSKLGGLFGGSAATGGANLASGGAGASAAAAAGFSVSPSALIKCIKAKNETFNNTMQQDAHEFILFILSDIIESEQVMMRDPRNRALFAEAPVYQKKKGIFTFPKSKSHSKSAAPAVPITSHVPSAATSKNGSSPPKHEHGKRKEKGAAAAASAPAPQNRIMGPLQAIMQGRFASLTACTECNTITSRDEVFIDLSVETNQGRSLLHSLSHIGSPEYFYGDNKLHCDKCKQQVRAARTFHVEQLPQYALLIHLKRFQYDPQRANFTKKADHVALPLEMDLEEREALSSSDNDDENDEDSGGATGESTQSKSTQSKSGAFPSAAESEETKKMKTEADDGGLKKPCEEVRRKLRGVARHKARFELTGFVAHMGEGPNLGHYFTCVRYGPQLWKRFDDDTVCDMTEREVQQYFGVPINVQGVVTSTAYIVLYERVA